MTETSEIVFEGFSCSNCYKDLPDEKNIVWKKEGENKNMAYCVDCGK